MNPTAITITALSKEASTCRARVKISGNNSKSANAIKTPAVKAARTPMRLLYFIAKIPPSIVAINVITTDSKIGNVGIAK